MLDLKYPKVSVAMTSYNHDKYIEQAIQSVMDQDYPNLELIISDDFSKDHTRAVIMEFKEKFPNKIKVILNEHNIGMQRNLMQVIKACDGKYIAILESDDAWIYSKKISEQVQFLEENKDYFICSHQAEVKNELNANFPKFIPDNTLGQGEVGIDDILSGLFLPTGSIIFRNYDIDFPNWFEKYLCMDRALHLLNTRHGKIHYMKKIYSLYRTHDNGMWSSIKHEKELEILEDKIEMIESFNEYTNSKYKNEVESALNRYYMQRILLCTNNPEKYSSYILKYDKYLKQAKSRLFDLTNNKEIYIFGAGTAGIAALKFLNYIGIKVQGFIDNDLNKKGSVISNLTVFHPVEDFFEAPYFIIASVFYKVISEQLIKMNYSVEKDFIDVLETLLVNNTNEVKGLV